MEREGVSEAAFTESFVQTEKYCPHQRLREILGIAKASQVTRGAAVGQGEGSRRRRVASVAHH